MKLCHIVHQYTKYGGKQTQHREVIGINNNYKYLLPEAVVVVYKLVNSVLMKTCHSTSALRRQFYQETLPQAICCGLQTCLLLIFILLIE